MAKHGIKGVIGGGVAEGGAMHRVVEAFQQANARAGRELKLGENLYSETEASNTPQLTDPGQDGAGSLRQGFLELSNVAPVEELIDLITTQRAFELNSQAAQAGDQMLQLVANLRRF